MSPTVEPLPSNTSLPNISFDFSEQNKVKEEEAVVESQTNESFGEFTGVSNAEEDFTEFTSSNQWDEEIPATNPTFTTPPLELFTSQPVANQANVAIVVSQEEKSLLHIFNELISQERLEEAYLCQQDLKVTVLVEHKYLQVTDA
jgi:hypothetical protein